MNHFVRQLPAFAGVVFVVLDLFAAMVVKIVNARDYVANVRTKMSVESKSLRFPFCEVACRDLVRVSVA